MLAHTRRGLTVALLTVFLAACKVVPETRPGPVPTPTPEPSEALPTDAGRHRVALLVPLTGENAAVGQSIANAAQMALIDTNAANLRITTYDTATGAGQRRGQGDRRRQQADPRPAGARGRRPGRRPCAPGESAADRVLERQLGGRTRRVRDGPHPRAVDRPHGRLRAQPGLAAVRRDRARRRLRRARDRRPSRRR